MLARISTTIHIYGKYINADWISMQVWIRTKLTSQIFPLIPKHSRRHSDFRHIVQGLSAHKISKREEGICDLWLLDFTEQLPEVLYLQLDNAGNQNKNRYVLGFCAFLVESRIFRKVSYPSILSLQIPKL